jgi:1-deoxy-D-xylulose-5-phosphate synthase
MSDYPLLERINDPADLRALTREELSALAVELRRFIVESVAATGGHFSSNLGTVELTIALHYVFATPGDRIIWDVGHQTYGHKILTGRRAGMATLRQRHGIAGFPRRDESPYDAFGTAHSSTSISAAIGMAVAARAHGENRRAIAVIGDGAMSAGMAFEALNNVKHSGTNVIVVLNDNEMSISEPVGALNNYLAKLMSGRFYAATKATADKILSVSPTAKEFAKRIEGHAKGMITPSTLFEEFGLNYTGPIDGHNLDVLIDTLTNVKRLEHSPQFLHVVTKKGYGYKPARSTTTARASSTPPWASSRPSPPRTRSRSPPTRRSSGSGCATWPAPTSGSWASRPPCARARAWWPSRRNSRTATSTWASPSSTPSPSPRASRAMA